MEKNQDCVLISRKEIAEIIGRPVGAVNWMASNGVLPCEGVFNQTKKNGAVFGYDKNIILEWAKTLVRKPKKIRELKPEISVIEERREWAKRSRHVWFCKINLLTYGIMGHAGNIKMSDRGVSYELVG